MAAKFDLKDPNNQKILVGILLAFAVVFLYYYFVFVPQKDKFAELDKNKNEKLGRLNKAKVRAAKFEQLVADVKNLEVKLKDAQGKLPKEKDIPSILTNITRIGNQVMAPVTMVRPQNIVKKDFYAEVPITVHVEGTYHGLGNFLAQVGALERIINPVDLNIIMARDIDLKRVNTIEATMTAKTFIFLPPAGQEEVGKY